MRLIGPIVSLQVQPRSLKVGENAKQRYYPSPLTSVPSLTLEPGGVWGIAADGARIDDVHHADHPASKNRGENSISLGFTSHYAAIRARFGDHLPDGIAGENLLVASDEMFNEEDFAAGIVVETASGLVHLMQVIVAAPCAPFTRFAMRFPDDARPDPTVTENLRFLDNGMRGFYAGYAGEPVRIAVGDRVSIAD